MNWHLIFHWFSAHWHYIKEIKIPYKHCQLGSTYTRGLWKCCICGKDQVREKEYYIGG